MNLKKIRTELEQKKGRRDQKKEDLEKKNKALINTRRRQRYVEQARAILQEVAKATQAELEYHVTEPPNLALSAVFGEEAYKLAMEFNISAGRTEIPLYFERDGRLADPMGGAGYGQVDVASYALKISLRDIQNPAPRNVIIMDEPFKNPDKKARPKIGAMMREISHKRGLQHIIISHDPALIESADRIFHIKKKGKTSVIEVEDR